jgi:hypothetical protein
VALILVPEAREGYFELEGEVGGGQSRRIF